MSKNGGKWGKNGKKWIRRGGGFAILVIGSCPGGGGLWGRCTVDHVMLQFEVLQAVHGIDTTMRQGTSEPIDGQQQ
eukprot:5799191-Amphidinium_carterae.1